MIGQTIKGGLIGLAADLAIGKAEEKLFGWTPENTKAAEDNIRAKGLEWRSKHGLAFGSPAKADEAGAAIKTGLDVTVAPKIDPKPLDDAKAKADEAGAAIKTGLDVTVAPKIDLSAFDAFDARLAKSLAALQKFGAMAGAVPAQAAKSIRHGYQPGSHALHDGSENY
jgi:hypothetical protein